MWEVKWGQSRGRLEDSFLQGEATDGVQKGPLVILSWLEEDCGRLFPITSNAESFPTSWTSTMLLGCRVVLVFDPKRGSSSVSKLNHPSSLLSYFHCRAYSSVAEDQTQWWSSSVPATPPLPRRCKGLAEATAWERNERETNQNLEKSEGKAPHSSVVRAKA